MSRAPPGPEAREGYGTPVSLRGLAVSDFTLLEVSLLFRKKRFDLVVRPDAFFSEIERRFVVLPITARTAVQACELPASCPKDPADRIIGATALIEDILLLTADHEIRKSRAIQTIWQISFTAQRRPHLGARRGEAF